VRPSATAVAGGDDGWLAAAAYYDMYSAAAAATSSSTGKGTGRQPLADAPHSTASNTAAWPSSSGTVPASPGRSPPPATSSALAGTRNHPATAGGMGMLLAPMAARPIPHVNVNNRLVPEDTVLNDGDLVILTREKVKI
jgi:hypothetical protein